MSFAEVFKMQKIYSDRVEKTAIQGFRSGIAIATGIGSLASMGAMTVTITYRTVSKGTAITSLH